MVGELIPSQMTKYLYWHFRVYSKDQFPKELFTSIIFVCLSCALYQNIAFDHTNWARVKENQEKERDTKLGIWKIYRRFIILIFLILIYIILPEILYILTNNDLFFLKKKSWWQWLEIFCKTACHKVSNIQYFISIIIKG